VDAIVLRVALLDAIVQFVLHVALSDICQHMRI